MSGKQDFIAPRNADELKAMFPEMAASIRQEGVGSVDTVKIKEEAAVAEKGRILGLAKVHFGEEVAGGFSAIIETNVTAEQYLAIRPKPVESPEEAAIKKAKAEALAAIQGTGAGNPGAGGGADTGDKDFTTLVKETMAIEKCTKAKAMKIARLANPKAHEAWLQQINS